MWIRNQKFTFILHFKKYQCTPTKRVVSVLQFWFKFLDAIFSVIYKKLRDVQQERKETIFLQVYNCFKQVWYCKHQKVNFLLEYLHCYVVQNINLVVHIAASWRSKYPHSCTYHCIFSVLQLQSFLSFDLSDVSCQSLYPP